MKILMVNKFLYPRGGAETYMLRIGEELTRRGHQVEYFGMYDEKNTVGNAEGLTTVNMDFHASGAEKLLYPFRIIYSGEARRKMRQVIDRFHPDIIHFNNINFQLTPSVILAGAEKNIPMVQTVHDLQMLCPNHMMMEFGTWKLCEECSGKKCKMACVRKKCIHGSRAKSLIGAIEGTIYTSSHVYDRVARYICPSRFIEEKLLTVPRYAGKTTMIHNFLSKTAEIDVPKGDYVLYFGRLSEEKGIDRILAAWRGYTDEAAFVFAETDGESHNTITPIARMREGQFELDLVLRNNITTEEYPLGVYHPHQELHHIKKENIGLIEVMGLAVLPARLKDELDGVARALVRGDDLRADETLAKHADWAEELKTRHVFTAENAEDLLRQEVGAVFAAVLEHAGVFKRTPEGQKAFLRFIQSV